MTRPILFSYLAFVPHLAVFSYLAFCSYFAFFSPSRCLLLSWLPSMPAWAFFPYSIFHSLSTQTSIQSESRRDGATASPSSLISAPNHHRLLTPHTRTVQYTFFTSFCLDQTLLTPLMSTGWSMEQASPGARSQQRHRSLVRRLAEAGRGWQKLADTILRSVRKTPSNLSRSCRAATVLLEVSLPPGPIH